MSDFDEVFDFVVAGAGGGSMCAALVMRTAGKSALVLEKTEFLGGTTARSGGAMWIPNNRLMKRAGVVDGTELAATMPYLAAALDEMLDLTAISQSWRLKLLGARIVLRTIAARLRGQQLVAGGASLQGRMLQAAVRAGVELRTQSAVSELIVEEGAVRGVVTTRDGRPWRVGARLGVLVNADGFARNQEMRDRYQGRPADRLEHGGPPVTPAR